MTILHIPFNPISNCEVWEKGHHNRRAQAKKSLYSSFTKIELRVTQILFMAVIMPRKASVIKMLKLVTLWIWQIKYSAQRGLLILKSNVCLLCLPPYLFPKTYNILENTRDRICPTVHVFYIYLQTFTNSRKYSIRVCITQHCKISSILTMNVMSKGASQLSLGPQIWTLCTLPCRLRSSSCVELGCLVALAKVCCKSQISKADSKHRKWPSFPEFVFISLPQWRTQPFLNTFIFKARKRSQSSVVCDTSCTKAFVFYFSLPDIQKGVLTWRRVWRLNNHGFFWSIVL